MTLALIDGDILLYKAACAAETKVKWPDGEYTFSSDLPRAKSIFDKMLATILKDTKPTDHLVCISDTVNFRKEIAPDYKAHRKVLHKPEHLNEMREYALGTTKAVVLPRLEADDVMGIYATADGAKAFIVTLDKDLAQIPADIYNMDTKKWSRAKYRECDKLFMTQVLTGDETDNFKGCQGTGPAKAAKILTNPRRIQPVEHTLKGGPRKGQTEIRWVVGEPCSMWEAVVDQYLMAGMTLQDALVQARLARILQAEDYINDEIILWGKQYE